MEPSSDGMLLDSAFMVLTTATMISIHDGWQALLEEYHKNDIDNLVDIESDFTMCKLSKLETEISSIIAWLTKDHQQKVGEN
jgi:hypothetical protein